jgi:serum/glucocorticoid-regulated kinase 2
LLQRKPSARLGLNGPAEVKAHPWFEDFDWGALDRREIKAPFVPDRIDNFDQKVSNDDWNDEESDKMKEAANLIKDESVQELFNGYYYDKAIESFQAHNMYVKKDNKKPVVTKYRSE